LSDISKTYFRRYLLVDSGLEIFMTKCKAYFLNFDKDQRQTFLTKLLTQKLPNLKFCQQQVDEVKSLALRATLKWQRGKLSNFDYLMKLNCYAWRSYNDLSQYPILPWVLGECESEKIDLLDSAIYRDLVIPVGALSEKRLSLLHARVDEAFDDDSRYLFVSLYSSAATVIGHLIRLEPFTSHCRAVASITQNDCLRPFRRRETVFSQRRWISASSSRSSLRSPTFS
jgi:hypothetical protein